MTVPARPRVVGIVGWKNSGKTTLATRLISELSGRGLRVASVKHAHHEIVVDDGETDSARHRRAGSQQAAVVSPTRWALVRELRGDPEPDLEEVLAKLDPCDVVIVEGFKSAPIAKIEVRREGSLTRDGLAEGDGRVIAIAADHPIAASPVPVFGLDDIVPLADLILGFVDAA